MVNKSFGTAAARKKLLRQHRGILSRVSEDLNVSPSTVSRTFHGTTKKVDPAIVQGIEAAIREAAGKR